ncbi:hypothetical protein AB0J83_14720 [Actinoplanes sp. NPDC049596]|uniref:hypothetical protein n=1 Tax=unclassified Actinoplanes TaxID=2626549 RepID=UPI0034341E5B
MAEPSAPGLGSRDTIYRRPPAQPETEDPSWFKGGAPAAPAAETTSRASFGFGDGPISPVRHPASPTSPAPVSYEEKYDEKPEPIAVELPVRRMGDTAERRMNFSDTGERPAIFPDLNERPAPTGAPIASPAPAPAPAPALIPAAPRQSRGVTVGIVLMSLVVLIAGSIVGVVYFTGSDDDLDSVLQLGAGDNGKRTAVAPLDNRTKASFELLAASNKVNVSIGELGDDLYRISTPEDAGILPSPVVRDDDVKLQVTRDGDGTGGEIDVVLAAKVSWQLRFSGYAEEQVIDLSGGQISGIEMVGGMRTAQLTLSRPAGTVPIKINGAVEKLALKSPADSPVRVKVGGGAQTVVAGTRTLKDVAAGSTLTPKDWAVPNRYDVGAGAPITTLTVSNA